LMSDSATCIYVWICRECSGHGWKYLCLNVSNHCREMTLSEGCSRQITVEHSIYLGLSRKACRNRFVWLQKSRAGVLHGVGRNAPMLFYFCQATRGPNACCFCERKHHPYRHLQPHRYLYSSPLLSFEQTLHSTLLYIALCHFTTSLSVFNPRFRPSSLLDLAPRSPSSNFKPSSSSRTHIPSNPSSAILFRSR